MDKQAVIEKVRFLLNLGQKEGTNENEASAAMLAADKLIKKFNLFEEDYKVEEVKPIYTDDDLLFTEGKEDEVLGRIQQRTGQNKEDLRKEIEDL